MIIFLLSSFILRQFAFSSYFSANMLATNSLKCCLSEKAFIAPSSLYIFAGIEDISIFLASHVFCWKVR